VLVEAVVMDNDSDARGLGAAGGGFSAEAPTAALGPPGACSRQAHAPAASTSTAVAAAALTDGT